MATFTVTTAADIVADDGRLSLREAVRQANATTAADRILFADGLEGRTLTLAQGELTLKQDVTIDGDRDNDGREVTLSGGGESRVLHVTGTGNDVLLRQLALTQGQAPEGESGGAILSRGGSLHLDRCTVSDSKANSGGGIYAAATLYLHETRVSDNTSDNRGGGIAVADTVSLTILSSAILGNSAAYGAGGVDGGYDSAIIVESSTFSENYSADDRYGAAALAASGGTLFVLDSRFSKNMALF